MFHQSSARSVYNAFGFSGGPARVHNEEGVIEGKLLKVQSISVRIFRRQIDEFGVEDLLAVSFQLDVPFLVNERKHNNLKIMNSKTGVDKGCIS